MGLSEERCNYQPQLPAIFDPFSQLSLAEDARSSKVDPAVEGLLPHISYQHRLTLSVSGQALSRRPLRVGVVFSGGQAAGGHNVIAGLFDCLRRFHPSARLFGFLNGPSGVVKGDSIELTSTLSGLLPQSRRV